MAQVSKYPLSKDVDEQISDLFIETISRITDKKLVTDFLSDLLTPTEKIMLTKRLAIYYMLGKGYDYRTIKHVLKVSSATVASSNRTYKYLGTGSKRVIMTIVRDEKIEEAIHHVITGIVKEFSTVRKGSALWELLHKELKKNNDKPI